MQRDVALITGGTSGIGYELGKVMGQNGHDLILVARSESRLLEVAEEFRVQYNIRVWTIVADLSRAGSAQFVYHQMQEKQLFPGILVNNAGFGDMTDFVQSDLHKIGEMIQLNVSSLTELTWYLLPEMVKRQKGRIVNLASIASFIPGPGMAVYHATKAYVLFLGEGLSEELRQTGVKVITLCPGPTRSGFQEKANMQDAALVNTVKIPDAAEVAQWAYRKIISGNRVYVHGFSNHFIPAFARLTPLSWMTRIIRQVYSLKKTKSL
jgi:short-subunit dehydrogenase